MRKKQSTLSPSTTTARTGMGMLLTTTGFYFLKEVKEWDKQYIGRIWPVDVMHTLCPSLVNQLTYLYVCLYKYSLYILACTHRLGHTVALSWSAKTPFDLYVCELGQLRNSGWCWSPYETRLRNSNSGKWWWKTVDFVSVGNSGSFWVLDDQLECLYHGRILAQQRKTKRKGSHAQRMISMNGTTWNLWGSSLDLLRARFDSRTVKRWYWSLQFRTRFCWNVGALCIWLDLNPDWIERISDQTYFQQNLGWGTSPILMSCDERDVKSPTKI